MPLWVSVGGFSAHEYAETCAALDDVEAIELNLSCPNVDEAPESAAEIVAACRAATDAAALREALAGRLGRRRDVARAVEAAGADGLSLVNTIRGLALDERTLRPTLARGTGGYSGTGAEADRARRRLRVLRARRSCRSSGMGGVRPDAMRSSWSLPERRTSRSGRFCSPIPTRRPRPRRAAPRRSSEPGFRRPRTTRAESRIGSTARSPRK